MVNVAGSGIAPFLRRVVVGDDDPVRLDPLDDLRAVERVDHVEHLGLLGRALQGRRLARAAPRGGRGARARTPTRARRRAAGSPPPGLRRHQCRSRSIRPIGPCADRLAAQVAPQVVGQLLRRGVAAGGRLGHRLQADRLQVARDLVVELPRRARLVLEDLEDQHPPVAPERALAGQQLVEDDARGCRCRCGRRPGATRPAPARATCRPACPGPGPPGSSSVSSASRLARPKSMRWGRPSASSRMFEGLMSRWITPWRWA